jgi:putative nucleotidyltransferase with HDIG domain
VDADKLTATLQGVVVGRIQNDTLVLPTLPEVAAKCGTLARAPDLDVRAAASAIEADPVLAARLVGQAASAGGDGGPPTSIPESCTRVGTERVRGFLADAATRQLFQSRDARIAAAARQVWEHAVAVALMARDLAAIVGGIDAEAAYLAGLIHDVGKAIGAAILLELERSSADGGGLTADRWLAAVQGAHRAIALALATKLRLPAPLARAMDAGEFDTSDRQSLGNVVCFANAVAKLQGIHPGAFSKDEAEALLMVGRSLLGVDDAVVARLSNGLKARVARATA